MSIESSREIYAILAAAGPMFDGGSDSDRMDISDAWDSVCTPSQLRRWIEAGCWDPATASRLSNAGFHPAVDTLRYIEGRERDDMDAMYALCNGDVSMRDVRW